MATIQFDLVSPERKLASLEASEVEIPGAEGDFTAMAEHSPVLTTLRPGVLRVKSGNDVTEYLVTGGFVEVSATSTTVLAEEAIAKSDATTEQVEALIAAAVEAGEGKTGGDKDVSDKLIADTRALLDAI